MPAKDLLKDEMPREKAQRLGIGALTDSELLAIILRTGTKGKGVIELSKEMIEKAGGLNELASKSHGYFKNEFNGIGRDKAITIAALFEIAKRVQTSDREYLSNRLSSAVAIADYFVRYLKNESVEKFMVAFFTSNNKIIRIDELFSGTIDYSLVHVRELIKSCLDHNAKSIVLCHNHPSGSPEISTEDKKITKKVRDACNLFNIVLLDHIVVAGKKHVSFSELGLLNSDK
ncbi:MAG: DNA repair protein RadC [Ignavibacteriales bacterium]|jgi:DNA repair protein RadC|nr:MAG: DNA repair protein RadC [Ignavibacteriaceae bacterium]MBW7873279.1 DNA repair protein RadC [Ignavibacteria bacterium]MCZ2143017.1 DNA repair protein RadC [Ignavibacteriales bacterium]OQY77478.1 MAG: hypothetical protein B6D45_02835 [Ignavibacteriales bacterium UTCHB3]MBV6444707.1 hypothetical protein [Ignavibacteriaceae bacterium]